MTLRASRFTLFFVLLPIAIVAQAPARETTSAPGEGIIRGVTTALDTGKPLRGGVVQVFSADSTPPVSQSTYADAQGRYEFTGLKGGRYSLTARKSGYLDSAYGQTSPGQGRRPLDLSESTPLDKINLTLPR